MKNRRRKTVYAVSSLKPKHDSVTEWTRPLRFLPCGFQTGLNNLYRVSGRPTSPIR